MDDFLSRACVRKGLEFQPSEQEFADPYACIRQTERTAGRLGIWKIVPPEKLRPNNDALQDVLHAIPANTFSITRQRIRQPPWNDFESPQPVEVLERNVTLDELQERSARFGNRIGLTGRSLEDIERRFLEMCTTSAEPRCPAEYSEQACSIPGSTTPETHPIAQTKWRPTRLSKDAGSLFRHLSQEHSVHAQPTTRIGFAFGTSFWRRALHSFYTLDLLHGGSAKIWYCVPQDYASVFEDFVIKAVYGRAMANLVRGGKDWEEARKLALKVFGQNTTMVSPKDIIDNGILIVRVVQEANEVIVAFPGSYCMSFCTGFNCSEQVHLASPEWLAHGEQSLKRARRLGLSLDLPYEEMLVKEAIMIGLSIKGFTPPTSANLVVMQQTIRHLREQRHMRTALLHRGASHGFLTGPRTSGNCGLCGRHCFLSFVSAPSLSTPVCLECAMQDGFPLMGAVVFSKRHISELDNMSAFFHATLSRLQTNGGKDCIQPAIGYLNTPESPLPPIEHTSVGCLHGFRERRVFVDPRTPKRAYVLGVDVLAAMGLDEPFHEEKVVASIWTESNRHFEAYLLPLHEFPQRAFYRDVGGEVREGFVLSLAEIDVVLKTIQGAAHVGLSQFVGGLHPRMDLAAFMM